MTGYYNLTFTYTFKLREILIKFLKVTQLPLFKFRLRPRHPWSKQFFTLLIYLLINFRHNDSQFIIRQLNNILMSSWFIFIFNIMCSCLLASNLYKINAKQRLIKIIDILLYSYTLLLYYINN